MGAVYAPTPQRIHTKADASAQRPLPDGFERPPAQRIPLYIKIRGMQYRSGPNSAAQPLVHRDIDVPRNIMHNALSMDATGTPLPWMAQGKHADDPAKGAERRFYFRA